MQKEFIPGYHARGSRAPSKHCRPEYRPDQYEPRYTPSWSRSLPQETMTQTARQYTTKNCLAEIGNKCIRRSSKLSTREMEKKKKKSFERGVYEDAPGKKQWPWRLRGIAFVSLSFPAAVAPTLALPLLLRKSPASFEISSLTVVHETASLLSFTQTVVFFLYLQIVRNSNFKTP